MQSTDKFFVIKAGPKTESQYASFSEVKAMPQMIEMLGQFKKQMELEAAFMKRIEEYKQGLTVVPNGTANNYLYVAGISTPPF